MTASRFIEPLDDAISGQSNLLSLPVGKLPGALA